MPTPKISVIIPVYNSEKFLKKSLDSIRFQTYQNLEIICIDDGSTDNSLEILKDYAKVDERFVVFNKQNEGPGRARNIGINMASGDYISFVDSDDWLLLDLYEKFRVSVKSDTDIYLFNAESYVRGYNDIVPMVLFTMDDWRSENDDKSYTYRDCKRPFSGNLAAWNRIYKTNFLRDNHIYFPERVKFEDVYFATKCFLEAKSIQINPNVFYRYRNFASNSISQECSIKTFDIFKIVDLIEKEVTNSDLYEYLKYALFQYKFNAYFNNYTCCPENLRYSYFEEMKKRLQIAGKKDLDIRIAKQLNGYSKFEIITQNNFEMFDKLIKTSGDRHTY